MAGWLPGWAWAATGIVLAVTAAYYVLADAIDVLMKRWARRTGCPVCGAGPVARRAEHGQADAQDPPSAGESP